MELLAARLRQASARIAAAQAAALRPDGVTPAEWAVLDALFAAGAVAPSVLAEECRLSRGAVTKLVDRLRAKRLVVRAAAGREDRRYQTIALTGQGASLVPRLRAAVTDAEAAAFVRLSSSERASLAAALAKLAS